MKLSSALALFSLTLAPLAAQTAPCASMNDVTTAVSSAIYSWSSAGPNVNAWAYTPSAPLSAAALQIFTANNYFAQSMTLEIWSDSTTTNLPAARLAGGTWKITQTNVNSWQGANLDAPVLLTPSSRYWIVLTEPGWSTVPIEPGGSPLSTARFTGGAWVAGSAGQALKFRLFCSPLDQLNVKVKGSACTWGTSLGSHFVNQAPTIGNANFMLEGSGFPAGAPALVAFGVIPTWPSLPIPGADPACLVHTDLVLTLAGTVGTGNVRDPVAASGEIVFPVAIPANPALAGGVLSTQLFALWSGSSYPVNLVSSNALLITLY